MVRAARTSAQSPPPASLVEQCVAVTSGTLLLGAYGGGATTVAGALGPDAGYLTGVSGDQVAADATMGALTAGSIVDQIYVGLDVGPYTEVGVQISGSGVGPILLSGLNNTAGSATIPLYTAAALNLTAAQVNAATYNVDAGTVKNGWTAAEVDALTVRYDLDDLVSHTEIGINRQLYELSMTVIYATDGGPFVETVYPVSNGAVTGVVRGGSVTAAEALNPLGGWVEPLNYPGYTEEGEFFPYWFKVAVDGIRFAPLSNHAGRLISQVTFSGLAGADIFVVRNVKNLTLSNAIYTSGRAPGLGPGEILVASFNTGSSNPIVYGMGMCAQVRNPETVTLLPATATDDIGVVTGGTLPGVLRDAAGNTGIHSVLREFAFHNVDNLCGVKVKFEAPPRAVTSITLNVPWHYTFQPFDPYEPATLEVSGKQGPGNWTAEQVAGFEYTIKIEAPIKGLQSQAEWLLEGATLTVTLA